MEFLVTMTTHVPDGTPGQAVDDVRAREAAHGRHEAEIGHADPDWPDWYAAYRVRERIGADHG